ncbi:coiled-coil domain-containing protein 55-domain containing protein [Lentinula edodes]|nr:coiled-coil domain-containing protein 55-domain containing protein [Lentinula edodes]
MSKLSFSFNKPKTATPAVTATSKQPAAFSAFDDDEPPVLLEKFANKKSLAQNALTSKKLKKQMEEDKKVDSTSAQIPCFRKPKYIHGLLTVAATRRLDHHQTEEKMMQRERELEGDEFADKQALVTQAYKDQMEEIHKAEEEEKRRDGGSDIVAELQTRLTFLSPLELKKKQGRGTGMAHFYRRLLEDSEQSHEATILLSDLKRARITHGEGKDVELNNDNQIIDKRDLLSGGLNLSGTNTRNLKTQSTNKSEPDTDSVQVHRAVGVAASRQEIKRRRMREIELQMEKEQERARKEQEREEFETAQTIIAKRNNEEDVESARARYLERKRRRLEKAEDAGEQKL